MDYSLLVMRLVRKYGKKVFLKKGTHKILNEGIENITGEDDFISKDILGIKSFDGQKELDNKYTNYIISEMASEAMNKNVDDWTEDDYHFVRMTEDYSANIKKRQKVLEYLKYKK